MLNLNPFTNAEERFSPSDLDTRTEPEMQNYRAGGLPGNAIVRSKSAGKGE